MQTSTASALGAISGAATVRVAAVQIDCMPGVAEHNLNHAAELLAQAAMQGAEVVLLPELLPSGYLLSEAIWACAEPRDGRFVRWLCHQAHAYGFYLGATFLEADGDDFYNTFVLATPDGTVAGAIRKSPPASLEACFYRGGDPTAPHVIDTALGRIAVGICYENLRYERLLALYQARPSLVLMAAAAGRPIPMKPGDEKRFDSMVRRLPQRYARVLHAPVVLANRTGALDTPLPFGYPDMHSSFPGLSAIVDVDGMNCESLGHEEGVIVATVRKGPLAVARRKPQPYQAEWALRVPWYAPMWPQTQQLGEQSYQQNPRRAAAARCAEAHRAN